MGTAKVLQNGIVFLGKERKVNEIISAEEMGLITSQTRDALISQGILEVEGFEKNGASGLSVAEGEALRSLVASFDAFRESTEAEFKGLHKKLDALSKKKAK